LQSLADDVRAMKIEKSDIGWHLDDLELAARMVQADIDSDDED
jgi:hypothetical protein